MTLVEMQDEVGETLDALPRAMLLKRLREHQAEIHTNTEVIRLTPEAVIAEKSGEEVQIPMETVVMAVGVRPDRELTDKLKGSSLEVHVVGDAKEPRGVGEAIWEGFEVGARL
ncbi:FAD-dependent oxidoreductase [Gemmatimonadota bacterium]